MSDELTCESVETVVVVDPFDAARADVAALQAARDELVDTYESLPDLVDALEANEAALRDAHTALVEAASSIGLTAGVLNVRQPSFEIGVKEASTKFSRARAERLAYIRSVGSVSMEEASNPESGWYQIVMSTGRDGRGDPETTLGIYAGKSNQYLIRDGRGAKATFSVNEAHPRVIEDKAQLEALLAPPAAA